MCAVLQIFVLDLELAFQHLIVGLLDCVLQQIEYSEVRREEIKKGVEFTVPAIPGCHELGTIKFSKN